jgi:hypothetical protein
MWRMGDLAPTTAFGRIRVQPNDVITGADGISRTTGRLKMFRRVVMCGTHRFRAKPELVPGAEYPPSARGRRR